MPLLRLTCAFFAGRLVSYSIYVGGAALAGRSLGAMLTDGFRSPLGIALQIVMLLGLVALVRIDWTRVLARRVSGDRRPSGPAASSGPPLHAG